MYTYYGMGGIGDLPVITPSLKSRCFQSSPQAGAADSKLFCRQAAVTIAGCKGFQDVGLRNLLNRRIAVSFLYN